MRFKDLPLLGCLSLTLCFSTSASAHIVDMRDIVEGEASHHHHHDCHHESHRCHGECPFLATDYTPGRGTRIELKVDDLLTSNPVPVAGSPDSLRGFVDYLGFDQPGGPTTEQYWRLGLDYIQARFGIQTSGITYNPTTGIAFLTIAPDGSVVQTPGFEMGTNAIITPLTFGTSTYRCNECTNDVIYTKPWCRPGVRLVEFVLSFLGEVSLGGEYGTEATGTPGGRVTVTSGGVAFGRYVIRGKDGVDRYFDMRSWLPNIAFPSGGAVSYFSERFQINPVVDPDEFGGSGIGTLTIVSPTAPIDTPDGPRYPWYIRNDWWFGPIYSWPNLNDWTAYPGNTSSIQPYGRFAEPCNDVPPVGNSTPG
jgi:hypothetical protein